VRIRWTGPAAACRDLRRRDHETAGRNQSPRQLAPRDARRRSGKGRGLAAANGLMLQAMDSKFALGLVLSRCDGASGGGGASGRIVPVQRGPFLIMGELP